MSNDVKDKEFVDEYSYAPRKRKANKSKDTSKKEKNAVKQAKTKKSKKWIKITAIIIGAIILTVVLASVALSFAFPNDKVANNVYVGNINIGNMKPEDVASVAEGIIKPDASYIITCSGKQDTVTAKDIDLEVDSDKVAEKAMSIGKSKNIFINAFYAVKLGFGKEKVELELKYDKEKLDTKLFEFGATINGVSSLVEYEYDNGTLTLKPGKPGQNPDTSVARNEFIEAVSKGNDGPIPVTLDYAEVKKLTVDDVYSEIKKDVKDAEYARDENGNIYVSEEVVGMDVEKNDLKEVVEKVNNGREAKVCVEVVRPKKTKKELEESLFCSTLGTFSSDFSSSTANRVNNVTKAAGSINGVVLMPGDVFSYNDTIGNPSLANGYLEAPVFENGKHSTGVGGGVCQVSSTLYGAVLYSDLQVVERRNHSLTVGYVPKGQDATVAYGSIDFKFKNNTAYPVKISSVVDKKKLTVSIIGTKTEPDKTVEITHKLVSTTPPKEKITNDPNMPEGTRKVIEDGKNGYVYQSYKTIKIGGVEKSTVEISKSVYKATDREVVVGTGKSVATAVEPSDNTVENTTENNMNNTNSNGDSTDDKQDNTPKTQEQTTVTTPKTQQQEGQQKSDNSHQNEVKRPAPNSSEAEE